MNEGEWDKSHKDWASRMRQVREKLEEHDKERSAFAKKELAAFRAGGKNLFAEED